MDGVETIHDFIVAECFFFFFFSFLLFEWKDWMVWFSSHTIINHHIIHHNFSKVLSPQIQPDKIWFHDEKRTLNAKSFREWKIIDLMSFEYENLYVRNVSRYTHEKIKDQIKSRDATCTPGLDVRATNAMK